MPLPTWVCTKIRRARNFGVSFSTSRPTTDGDGVPRRNVGKTRLGLGFQHACCAQIWVLVHFGQHQNVLGRTGCFLWCDTVILCVALSYLTEHCYYIQYMLLQYISIKVLWGLQSPLIHTPSSVFLCSSVKVDQLIVSRTMQFQTASFRLSWNQSQSCMAQVSLDCD